MKGTPVLAHLCWWTTRGEKASKKREEEGKILKKVQDYGAGRSFTFGIVVLQAVPGPHWHWIIIFVLSCVGTKTII